MGKAPGTDPPRSAHWTLDNGGNLPPEVAVVRSCLTPGGLLIDPLKGAYWTQLHRSNRVKSASTRQLVVER